MVILREVMFDFFAQRCGNKVLNGRHWHVKNHVVNQKRFPCGVVDGSQNNFHQLLGGFFAQKDVIVFDPCR